MTHKIMPYFLSAFFLSLALTLVVRKLALHFNIIDRPDDTRKKHGRDIPLLGGLGIFFAFWLVAGYLIFFSSMNWKSISPVQLVGVFIGSVILIAIGWFDDKYDIPPKIRFTVSLCAVLAVIIGGVGLNKITNPFGGVINLNFLQIAAPFIDKINIIGSIIVFLWLMGMMYTTKILDGLDGLAAGVVAIGALVIFFLSNSASFYQPDTSIVALILFGACLGFLILNFYPAKIFLGEGGSLFLGYILGVLAIIAGGKIATALLVMGVPILDMARVLFVRIRRKQSIFKGDREHLHFRLVDGGFGHRNSVLLMYGLSFLFGITTLFLQSYQKLITLLVLVVIMIFIEIAISIKSVFA